MLHQRIENDTHLAESISTIYYIDKSKRLIYGELYSVVLHPQGNPS